jgi:hypothetical protein
MPTATHTREQDKEKSSNNFFIGALIGGAVAGAACLIGNALRPPSDEELMREAQHSCCDADRYLATGERILDVQRCNGVENALEEVERLVVITPQTSLREYNTTLQSLVSRLHKNQDALVKRIQSGNCSCNYHALQSSLDMSRAKTAILQPYTHFLTQHKDYFALLKLKNSLHAHYVRECNAYRLYYSSEQNRFLHEIRMCAMSSVLLGQYPYIGYVEKLEQDIDRLSSAIHKIGYQYHSLLAKGRDILRRMEAIAVQAKSDPDYARELRNREFDRLEQERIRLEQERIYHAQERLRQEKERLERERHEYCVPDNNRPAVRLVHHKVYKPVGRRVRF